MEWAGQETDSTSRTIKERVVSETKSIRSHQEAAVEDS